MKILILCRNTIGKPNWGHQLFRNEIGRQHDVLYYGRKFKYHNPRIQVSEIIKRYCNGKPDVLLTYDSYKTVKNPGIRKLKNIIKININVDYEANPEQQNLYFKKHRYDLIFSVVHSSLTLMRDYNVCDKLRLLPFSVDTNVYKKLDLPKTNDVCAVFSVKDKLYPNRNKIRDILKEMQIKTFSGRVFHNDLIKAINQSKIIVTSNNRFKHLSMRYTETLACGGFLLADKPKDLERVGFVDGKHLVIYHDLNDFKDKVTYYLKPENEKEREEIAKNGMNFVRENHSCKVRVKQMTDIIKEEFYK